MNLWFIQQLYTSPRFTSSNTKTFASNGKKWEKVADCQSHTCGRLQQQIQICWPGPFSGRPEKNTNKKTDSAPDLNAQKRCRMTKATSLATAVIRSCFRATLPAPRGWNLPHRPAGGTQERNCVWQADLCALCGRKQSALLSRLDSCGPACSLGGDKGEYMILERCLVLISGQQL